MSTIIPTTQIRNVLFAGHHGTGKTTLLERILFQTKAIAKMGSVQTGDTCSDHDPESKAHKHSTTSSIAFCTHNGKTLNIIDSPGAGDFLGHAIAAFPPVETVAVFIDAARGIEINTRRVMKQADELKLPRMIIINKIDQTDADLGLLLEQVRETFGSECIAINLPIKGNTDVIDVFDHDHAESDKPRFMSVEEAHRAIVEQVVEMDEELTGEYFEKGDHLDPAKLRRAFDSAMRAGHLVPVCFCSGKYGAGVEDLLHIIADMCPSPEHETPPALMNVGKDGAMEIYDPQVTPEHPTVLHVFKVINDPFMGKLSCFRVIDGVVKAKMELLHNEDKKPVRMGHIFKVRGKDHIEVEALGPGDIGCVAKVDEIKYNSVLHADPNLHLIQPRLPMPQPLYGVAVELKNHADEAKFTGAIHRMMEEDPCFTMERVAATGQTVLRALGELHMRVMLEKLKNRYHVEVATHPTRVAYKETITAKADGHHRHKKQTGGAGQFGEVYLRVLPLPADHPEGFEFENATVGGAIPKQYMPAIEKGCRMVLNSGAIAGYPIRGVRVEVYDGKYHDVDSKEVAFVAAGKKAFIDALTKARPVLLEPFVHVEITAPAGKMGDITADIAGKRGRVQTTDMLGADLCVVKAIAPLSELTNYSNELKSMTAGQGSFSMEYSHDERTPAAVQAQVIAAYKPKHEED
jgi:elongation factor G